MKRLLLLSALLLGAATASQAGVRFNIGIPFPAPPAIVVAPSAPVYVQPAPTYVEPAPVYCAPAPVVVGPPVIDFRFGGHRPYWQHFREEFHHDRDHDRSDHHRW